MGKKFYVNYENTPFLTTSKTSPQLNRLNWRCEILLTRNKEAIEGKRILDLASHDGRFSYGCLKLGARHIIGVEGRHHLVKFANENLAHLGFSPQNFSFVEDDVFNYLPKVKPKTFDTVLCFGFFYHTIRQIELLREIFRIQPKYFILDTFIITYDLAKENNIKRLFKWLGLIRKIKIRHVTQLESTFKKVKNTLSLPPVKEIESRPCLVFGREDPAIEGATIDVTGLFALPSRSFIELFLKIYGFCYKRLLWDREEIKDWTGIEDYRNRERISYIASLF